jgi:hypothetical protein
MPRPSRYAISAAICIFYAGVGFAAAQPADADTKEITAYKLTMEGLKKVINVNRAMVQQMMQDPKVREAMKIEAELDALEKKDEPTEADEKRMEQLRARQEQLEAEEDNPLGGDTKTLSEMEARIRKFPPMQQALQREGMSPRDYAKFWIAFMQAGFAHGMQKSGMLKQLPADVNAENVKFVAEHEAEIEAMTKALEALGKGKQ